MKVKRVIEIDENTLRFIQDLTEVIIPARSGKTLQKNVIEAIKFSKPYDEKQQGEWGHLGGDEWTCSKCGHVITTEGSWENPISIGAYHCENCGADMRGGAE